MVSPEWSFEIRAKLRPTVTVRVALGYGCQAFFVITYQHNCGRGPRAEFVAKESNVCSLSAVRTRPAVRQAIDPSPSKRRTPPRFHSVGIFAEYNLRSLNQKRNRLVSSNHTRRTRHGVVVVVSESGDGEPSKARSSDCARSLSGDSAAHWY